MTPFYFDIETIPAQDPYVKAELAAAVQAPGQYKKPESIQAWLDENRDAEAEAAWLKTSFDGGVGQCVAIGFAFGDGEEHVYSVPDLSRESEVKMLQDFFCAVVDAGPCVFVGHNIIGFDLPFLWKRCMVLGIKPPASFPRNPKPWSELVQDTMLLWDPTQRAGGSQERICRLLGLQGKSDGEIGGADVWEAVKAGKLDKVSEHCRNDITRTRLMHERMTFA